MTDPRIIAPPSNPGQVEPGPFSENELREQWNAQADKFNQWESLDTSEQLAWAQTRAIAAITEHMSSEAKQANPPTGSVVISEDQNIGQEEWWCNWYRCPRCNKSNIARVFSFCPDCGVKLQWEGGVTHA